MNGFGLDLMEKLKMRTEMHSPQKTQELEDGSKLEIWNLRRDRFDSENNLISRFVLTTVGRVVMNYTIIDSVSKT